MKVLHVITSMATGGAEALIAQIVPKMRQRGLEVDVALFDGSLTPFKQILIDAGVTIFDFAKGGSVYNPLHIFRLLRLMRRYDIVHTHNTAPQLFAAIGSMLCQVVLCTTEHNTSNRRRGWKWYAAIDRWMYRKYAHIITITPETRTNLQPYLDNYEKSSVIYNGIDIKKYSEAKALDEFKQFGRNIIKLVMTAGFRYQKDQDTIIRALKLLPARFHLFLVGDGERRETVERLAKTLGVIERVHFLGIRTDVNRIIASCDIYVQSSHWEGFGLAAVEAMASGLPVLASDTDGLKQVVEGAGILFPKGDYEALAGELLKLDSDPNYSRQVAERCKRRAADFDIDKMVDGYIDIYRKLINLVSSHR